MKSFIVSLWLTLSIIPMTWGQTTLRLTIQDAENSQPLIGATALLKPGQIGAASDTNGQLLLTVPAPGRYLLTCSFVGYENWTDSVTITGADSLIVRLAPEGEELEEGIEKL